LEELGKFLVLKYYVYEREDFDETIDGIIYGITIGLGFATAENIFNLIYQGTDVIFTRFASATLLHALLTGIIGYYLGLKKFKFLTKRFFELKALLVVILLHTVYNFFSYQEKTFYSFSGVLILAMGLFIILFFMIQKLKGIEKYRQLLADSREWVMQKKQRPT
jgi:RsiW-degrading membrane proteinase PrsW (M82 family)